MRYYQTFTEVQKNIFKTSVYCLVCCLCSVSLFRFVAYAGSCHASLYYCTFIILCYFVWVVVILTIYSSVLIDTVSSAVRWVGSSHVTNSVVCWFTNNLKTHVIKLYWGSKIFRLFVITNEASDFCEIQVTICRMVNSQWCVLMRLYNVLSFAVSFHCWPH